MLDLYISLLAVAVCILTPIAAKLMINAVFPQNLNNYTLHEFNRILQTSLLPLGILQTILHVKMKKASNNETFIILKNCNTSFLEHRFNADCNWENRTEFQIALFKYEYFFHETRENSAFENFIRFAFSNDGPYSCSEIKKLLKTAENLSAIQFAEFSLAVIQILNMKHHQNPSSEFAYKTNLKSYPKLSTTPYFLEKKNYNPKKHNSAFPLVNRQNYWKYLWDKPITEKNFSRLVKILKLSNGRFPEVFLLNCDMQLHYPDGNLEFKNWTNMTISMKNEHLFFGKKHLNEGLKKIYRVIFLKHESALRRFMEVLSVPFNGVHYYVSGCKFNSTVEELRTCIGREEKKAIKFKHWGFVSENFDEPTVNDVKTIEKWANQVLNKNEDFYIQLNATLDHFEKHINRYIHYYEDEDDGNDLEKKPNRLKLDYNFFDDFLR